MGLERNGAALFLRMCASGVNLGRMLTLGHQDVHLDLRECRRVLARLGQPQVDAVPRFADDLFVRMGATEVDAMDASGYEGATIMHDANRPVPAEWHQKYDFVFDGGTLEHVFDFPTAIKNCMQMVKVHGRFVSVTIANNWCGHGFYQFSPELFFRIFCAANGFSVVEMYLATADGRAYSVQDPERVRGRVELCNAEPMFLLVHARRDALSDIFARPPQQSDYVANWAGAATGRAAQASAAWKAYPLIKQLLRLRADCRRKMQIRRQRYARSLENTAAYLPVDLSI